MPRLSMPTEKTRITYAARTHARQLSPYFGGVEDSDIPLSMRLVGERALVKRMMTGPPLVAKKYKQMRKKLARDTVVPAIRREIPYGKRKGAHLKNTVRVGSSTLERVVVIAGGRNTFYGAALKKNPQGHKRGPVHFLRKGLARAEPEWLKGYEIMMKRFAKWLSGQPGSTFSRRGR